MTRRRFVAAAVATGSAITLSPGLALGDRKEKSSANKFCCFTKPFESLTYDELADRIAELGFDGIEATIREDGHIEPAEVPDELPKMVDALKKRDLEITVMASSINRVDEPHAETTLRTAARLGIRRYRMKYFPYDRKKPLASQLAELRPALKELAALNRELGITAVYQNHASPSIVGAPVWDLHLLLEDMAPSEIGVAFDIRHATVEGGTCWPLHFHITQPRLGIVYVKDFAWQGRQVENVPLGEGQVDPEFFTLLRDSDYKGPISLHVEYFDHRDPKKVPAHLEAYRKDLARLKKWLAG